MKGPSSCFHSLSFSVLCDRPWLVLRLSPLFGFSYDPDFFSRWADSIKEDFLNGGGRSQLPLNQSITVQVDKVHGLRGTTEDPEAVQIQVFAQRSRQALFTAFLLSVDCVTSVELGSHSEQITELPVMLCFGLKELEKVVRDSLGKCFNCVVSDVQIKEEDLKWITAMWSRLSSIEEEETEAERAGEASNVTLTYTFPADFKDTLRTVDVGLKQRQLGQLWRRYRQILFCFSFPSS